MSVFSICMLISAAISLGIVLLNFHILRIIFLLPSLGYIIKSIKFPLLLFHLFLPHSPYILQCYVEFGFLKCFGIGNKITYQFRAGDGIRDWNGYRGS
uniref:Uncharacterized protein n=1 Tax=Rhizophora mucronata TaxID=61149 RepID=A0A2P2MY86_RHIMU